MLMIGPQGYKVGPAGVRKRRKATVKKRRNTAPGFKALDPIYLHFTETDTFKLRILEIKQPLLLENEYSFFLSYSLIVWRYILLFLTHNILFVLPLLNGIIVLVKNVKLCYYFEIYACMCVILRCNLYACFYKLILQLHSFIQAHIYLVTD